MRTTSSKGLLAVPALWWGQQSTAAFVKSSQFLKMNTGEARGVSCLCAASRGAEEGTGPLRGRLKVLGLGQAQLEGHRRPLRVCRS